MDFKYFFFDIPLISDLAVLKLLLLEHFSSILSDLKRVALFPIKTLLPKVFIHYHIQLLEERAPGVRANKCK